jgi:hypothetical protein
MNRPMTDHPSADAARIREIREQLADYDKADAAFDAIWRPYAAAGSPSPLPHGYNEALETLKDSREEIEEGAVAIIRDLLDALTRSEQARQDMEIERDAAQDQCAGAERFGREQELRAVTAEQARQAAEQRANWQECDAAEQEKRAEQAESALANLTAEREDALIASASPSPWRPIAEAKDGVRVLAWFPICGCILTGKPDDGLFYGPGGEEPTLFMPLPDPPPAPASERPETERL